MADDISMGSSPGPQEIDIEAKARAHLASLCSLDERITEILTRGSAVVGTIAQGKMPGNSQTKKQDFKTALQEYNSLVEDVNGQLRREVKALHDESYAQLLPLYVTTQASSFGREKEDMLFESLEKAPRQ